MSAMSGRTLALLAILWLAGCSTLSSPALTPHTAAAGDRQILVTVHQPENLYGGPPRQRILAGPRNYDASPATRQTLDRLATEYRLTPVDGWNIAPLGVYCMVFRVDTARSVAETVAAMADDNRIAGVQRMRLFETRTLSGNRTDPYRHLQTALQAMQLEAVHSVASGRRVRIGVIDTGIDAQHPDLARRVVQQHDFVGSGGSRVPPELHGTAVAGVLAAVDGNGIGIVGAAPGVDLHSLRACWPAAAQRSLCNSFTLAKALTYAIEHRLDIVNLSLAGPADPLLSALVQKVLDQGSIVVGAAPTGLNGFPGGVEGVIAVYSNGGPVQLNGFAAPGQDILTLIPTADYGFLSGDSLATALVTGVVALLREKAPQLEAGEIRGILHRATTEDIDGRQLIDACAALRQVTDGACGPPVLLGEQRPQQL